MNLIIQCWKCGFIVDVDDDTCIECGAHLDHFPKKSSNKKEED